MSVHRNKVNVAIRRTNWHLLEHAMASTGTTSQFSPEFYLILLIEPADDKRLYPKTNVITRTVMRLICKEHGVELNSRPNELFHDRDSSHTMDVLGMYKRQIHQLLESSIDAPLDTMAIIASNHQDTVNDNYVASNVGAV
jgi:hypothetical protein